MPDGQPKYPGVPCQYLCVKGCGIYQTRPTECSGYACMWLDGLGTDLDRPDRLGVMFEFHDQEDPTHPVVLARTTSREMAEKPRVGEITSMLRNLRMQVAVVHPENAQGWLIHLEMPE